MKMLLSLFITMSLFTACNRNERPVPVDQEPLPAKILRDVSYGDDSLQRMDIYLPNGRTPATTKSIVLIHGGGWNAGNKTDFVSYIDSFQRRMPEYAIFNLNYRLYNGNNRFPTQEQDVKRAIDQIVERAQEYGINSSELVLLGASAGGHLALLQAYKYRQPAVRAVIDFFGPADLEAMYARPWHPLVTYALQMITGTTPVLDPDIYRNSSPVNFITAQSPPTLIFHGDHDQVVNLSQSKALQSALTKAGVENDLIVYPGAGHGWYGPTLSKSFDRIEAFLRGK